MHALGHYLTKLLIPDYMSLDLSNGLMAMGRGSTRGGAPEGVGGSQGLYQAKMCMVSIIHYHHMSGASAFTANGIGHFNLLQACKTAGLFQLIK